MSIRNTLACVAVAVSLTVGASASANTLKIAYDIDPESLDPHEHLASSNLKLTHLVFDPLVRWTRDFQFEPRLAESWQRIDELTMRFNLRRGVTFHSGNPMTAADVCWTFARLKKSPDFKGLFEPFASCKEKGDYTVDLKTHKPYPLVLNQATYIFPMDSKFYSGIDANGEPKDAITKHGESFASRNMSGTGPFIVASREQGVRIEFKRFPNYWDSDSAGNVDKIIQTTIGKGATRTAALLAGDVDFISPISPNDMTHILHQKGVKPVFLPGTYISMMQFNQVRQPAFADARVRRAIVHAVNSRVIVKKILRGLGTPAEQQSPPGYLGHNENLKPRYDVEKAKALMAAAGYADGLDISMMAPNYAQSTKVAEAIAGMLRRINIRVNLKTTPRALYWQAYNERAADMMIIGWHSDTEDSGNFSEFLLMCPDKATGYGQYNSGNYCNPALDKLVRDAQSETNPAARAIMLKKIEEIAYRDAAFLPLYWPHLVYGMKEDLDIEPVLNVIDMPYWGELVVR